MIDTILLIVLIGSAVASWFIIISMLEDIDRLGEEIERMGND